MNNIFDSHAHYNDHAFDEDRDELLKRLPHDGIDRVVNIGASMSDCEDILALTEKYDYIYGALGVHPDDAGRVEENFTDTLKKYILSGKKIKAVGEIGLDYHYEGYSKEDQLRVFTAQLELAKELDLPVVIHSRDACEDTMAVLRKYRPVGVMHCFGYSAETAEEVISLGMYIGFTGVLTFKNAKKALKAIKKVPTDRLLVETDCPYMAPEPFRGKRCDSSMLVKTIEKAAEVLAFSPQQLADITNENGRRLYRL